MKIGILAQLQQKNITGINRVTMGLMTELLKMDQANQYLFLGDTSWLPLPMDSVDLLYTSDGAIALNFLEAAYNFDVIHSHYRPFEICPRMKCAKILTIHDLIPYLHPEWNNNLFDFFDGSVRKCAQNADYVIAVSEHTRRDVIEHFQIKPEKVKRIYNALYPKTFFSSDQKGRKPQNVPEDKFLLTVSAVGANKNQAGLVEAFLNFKSHHRTCPLKLVITGPVRQYQVVRDIMEKHRDVSDCVIFTGFVSDEELVWLYRMAEAFIYVSLYEGMGLPILEALSVGKAVICSNTSSMPEVGGEAVEYCDPYDVEAIEHSIERVIFDTDYRNELESRAKGQAAKFSYEITARETLELYRTFE